ncbi:hypothetical protein QBC45DRAFT_330054, partial [Copromyces sp. CBS 386.78]
EDWPVIPANSSARNTYAEIQAVGDANFNRFGNPNVTVPWGPPCIRIEGGLPARGNLTDDGRCLQEWSSTSIVPSRRYVVDEEMGVVSLFVQINPAPSSISVQEAGVTHVAYPDSVCLQLQSAGFDARGARVPIVIVGSDCVVDDGFQHLVHRSSDGRLHSIVPLRKEVGVYFFSHRRKCLYTPPSKILLGITLLKKTLSV